MQIVFYVIDRLKHYIHFLLNDNTFIGRNIMLQTVTYREFRRLNFRFVFLSKDCFMMMAQ